MNYLPIVIFAYFLNSIAVTVDKFLLSKVIPDPLIYIFYFSLISCLAVFALPFIPPPTAGVLILGSVSTLFWTLGAYLMFRALKSGQIQRVIPVIGTITPLILLIMAAKTNSITLIQGLAAVLLVAGLVFLTLADWKGKTNKAELGMEVGSALFFALSYYLLRLAFDSGSFLTVLIWSKLILLPLGVFLLAIPSFRKKILPFLKPKKNLINQNTLLFAFGQLSAGVSELLLIFSISLANPAIVNSLQGVKYIFLLIFSLILGTKLPAIFRTYFSAKFLVSQALGIAFIGIGLYLLAF